MSASERAGQLLMVGLDVNAGRNSLDALVRDRHLGGVILLGGWYDGADRVRAATRHLESVTDQSRGEPGLFLAADQEGGNVQQLRGEGFTRIPSALDQGELSSSQLARQAAGWAEELHNAGINVNLAPVADTVPAELGRANAPIGRWDRQFSSDPTVVARMVGAFIDGMHRGGVAATVKHFPGIGRITGNTDLTAEGITDRQTTASDPYLRPFGAGIKAGADFVMVGSAIYSRIDPGVNAMFSRAIITDLLRGRMGYDGVVITDDVGAAKAVAATPVGKRATTFVDAGGDIVLTARPDTVPTMHRALTSRMSADHAFAAKVTQSATRVMTLKVDLGLASCR
ncbi:MAG TPA: glycoside hydrolase family 3 N-terminal domain-containing protein [Intrasporangium sp.]|uniref:glycoside hydrolase family 3 N-terminal domain-containing protein n=1 Tax=Intrasporangium sp. TaxID=1925024 RepID=UPI002F93CCBD